MINQTHTKEESHKLIQVSLQIFQIDLLRTERKHTSVSLVYFKIKRVPSFSALPVSLTSLAVPLCLRYDMQQISKLFRGTVQLVLSGTVLPGYPVLSGRLSKSRNSFPLYFPPLLGGHFY